MGQDKIYSSAALGMIHRRDGEPLSYEDMKKMDDQIKSQDDLIRVLREDSSAMANTIAILQRKNLELQEEKRLFTIREIELNSRIDSLRDHVAKCHDEMQVARNAPSAKALEELEEANKYLKQVLENAANIEVKMSETIKEQRQRIDVLERDNEIYEKNEEGHFAEIIEIKNGLTITRDAYWYLKEKSGQ